jgi:PAS domain S-box-containing protein
MDRHFEEQISTAQERLQTLLTRVNGATEDPESLVRDAVQDLSASLEELHLAEEELMQQNEDLAATRKAVEAERARYEGLFEFAPDGYVVTDESGVIRDANRAASEMLGASQTVLQGKPLVVFVTEADRGMFFTQLAQLRARGRDAGTLSFDIRLRPRPEGEFFASITVASTYENEAVKGLRWSLRDITLQRRAERRQQELLDKNQQQRTFLERLMETAPVGIAVVRGDDHRYEMANAHYRAMAPESQPVIGRPFAEVFPAVAKQGGIDLIQEVYRTATVVSVHEWSTTPGPGSTRGFWNVDLVPLWESDGSIQGVLIVSQEVTPQVRARREIERLAVEAQRQADQLTAVFDAMNDAVVVYDAEGVPVRANPRAVEAYGLDPVGIDCVSSVAEKLEIRTPTGRLVPVEGLPSSRALRGEQVENVRYRSRNARGEDLVIVASSAPLKTSGNVTGAVVVWHDVTEQERLHAQVDAQRERAEMLSQRVEEERDILRTIMESTHAQLAYLDADFIFIAVNDAYAEGAGYEPSELVGRDHFDLFPDRENEAIFERVRATGGSAVFHAKRYDHPKRGITYWDWSLVPVKDPETREVRGLVFSLLDVTEREELLVALEDERAKLAAIIQNAPEGIVVADEQARIELTNPAADRIYGRNVPYGESYARHAVFKLCRPDGTVVDPRDLPLTRSALDGEVCRNVELTFIRPGGERRSLLVNTTPIRDANGCITGAIGAFSDITERKRMEAAVRRYAEQLKILHEIDRAILASSTAEEIADATLSYLGDLVPLTRASVELFDFETDRVRIIASYPDEIEAGARVRELIWYEPIETLRKGEAYTVADVESLPDNALTHTLRNQGERSLTTLPLTTRDELIGVLSIIRDQNGTLTEDDLQIFRDLVDQLAIGIQQAQLRERIENYAEELEAQVSARTAQLRASEARFRSIFEQAAIGITLADVEGRMIATNPAFQAMLGYEETELQGVPYRAITHPDDLQNSTTLLQEMLEGERERYILEKRYVHKEGDVIWARLVASTVRNGDGLPQYVIGMVEDITQWKQAQAAMMQSEKLAMTGQLAASLAHEINNPLQTVIGCLGLAEEALEEDENVDTLLNIATEELQRTARIVGRLRDLGRPVEEDVRAPTDLNAIVERVLTVSQKELQNHGIVVEMALSNPLPRPQVVADRIEQVILNLVLNAKDAMEDGGELCVRTYYDDATQEVCITVIDEGSGMSPEVQSKLFNPFFTTKSEGMGLGLFVSHHIVSEYEGRIEVESEEGEGTAFTVRLPA